MNEETRRSNERVTQNNKIVSWIENFKAFLTRLVQESLGIIKKQTYKVDVQNLIELPSEYKIAGFHKLVESLDKISETVKSKKEFEKTDTVKIEGLLKELAGLVESLPKQFPKADDTNVVQAIKELGERFSSLTKVINDMPAPQMPDMKRIETILGAMSKSFVAWYDEESHRKKELANMKIESPKEIPTLVDSGREYNEDGDIVEYWERWSDNRIIRDVATVMWKSGAKSISWKHIEGESDAN